MPFPAVTICNFNRFWTNRIGSFDEKSLKSLLDVADFVDDYDSNDNLTLDTEFDFENFALNAGFRLNESLLRCDWKGKKNSCSAKDFSHIYLPSYGNCYTFNGKPKESNFNADDDTLYRDLPDGVLTQDLPGSGNGLRVLVNIDQDHYSESYKTGNHEAGLKFLVHARNDPPMMDTLGLAAAPGDHTFVAVRQSQFESLPHPHGDCIDSSKQSDKDYSLSICHDYCRFKFILDECNCRPLGYNYGNETVCSPNQMVECVGKALEEYRSSDQVIRCACSVPCSQTIYQSTVSTALFPSERVLLDISNDQQAYTEPAMPFSANDTSKLGMSNVNEGNKFQDFVADIRKNWVLLDIYFDQMIVMRYKQVESMTWSALLSDLGGQMGLFLGMSAITAAEVVEYVFRKMHQLFTRRKSTNKVVNLGEQKWSQEALLLFTFRKLLIKKHELCVIF